MDVAMASGSLIFVERRMFWKGNFVVEVVYDGVGV
jgi:hypothetical protein